MSKDFEKMSRVLLENSSQEDIFIKSKFNRVLQNLADSALIYHGFTPVPIKTYWGTGDDNIAYISDTECVINLDSPLDKDLDFYQRKACALGKLTHEVFGHGLFTDFALTKKLMDANTFPYEDYFVNAENINEIKTAYSEHKEKFNAVLFGFVNIVEDPVIEYLGTQIYPGFKPYVDFLTSQLRDSLLKQKTDCSFGMDAIDDFQDITSDFLKQARQMDVSDDFKRFPELKKTEIIFEDLAKMPNFEDRLKAACFAFDIFWKYIKEALKENDLLQDLQQFLSDFSQDEENQRTENGQANQRQQRQSQSKQTSSEKNGDEQNEASGNGSKGNGLETQSSQSKNNDKNEGGSQQEKSESSGNKGDDKKDNSSASGDREENDLENKDNKEENDSSPSETNEDVEDKDNKYGEDGEDDKDKDEKNGNNDKINEKLQSLIDSLMSKSLIDTIKEVALNMGPNELEKKVENIELSTLINNQGTDLGDTEYSLIDVKEESVDEYNKIFSTDLKRISKTLSKKVLEALKIRRKGNINYNLEEGQFIDIESIANGSDRVFMDINLPNKTPLCSVEVMIDMSGSMYGSKAHAATKTAMVLASFCRELKIPIDVYGHEYSSKTIVYKMKRFEEQNSVKNATKLLKALHSGGCNHDGVAYLYGIKNLQKRREPIKIFFILSDGEPNAGGFGKGAYKCLLSESASILKRNNITVVPIALDQESLYSLSSLYGTIVDGTDLNQLPKTITAILLKKIKKNI